MTIRYFLMAGALGALAACQPAIPDSGAGVVDPGRGVGFDNSIEAQRTRDAALQGAAQPVPTAPTVGTQELAAANTAPARPAPTGATTPAAPAQQAARVANSSDPDLAVAAAQEDASAQQANSGQRVVNASPSNPAPLAVSNPGISNETDFEAVSSRRSIEGDAARIAQNRAQYQVVQPTALPSRTGATGPNVVEYALSTRHPVGTRVHQRIGFNSAAKFRRNCATYSSDDEAQIDFLARGGPKRDRQGLDPDGDGYACGWDPAPFRRAAAG